jgi:uncharacterized Zn-finger protein
MTKEEPSKDIVKLGHDKPDVEHAVTGNQRKQNEVHILDGTRANLIFSCDKCNGTFARNYALRKHMQIHTKPKTIGKFVLCPECGKTFSKRKVYMSHKVAHLRERPFICSICDKTFKLNRHLTKHMTSHNTIYDHICPTCGKTFKSSHILKSHVNIHTKEKPFPCMICQKTFRTNALLKCHRRVHGQGLYYCHICEKSFFSTGHELVHSSNKPYDCKLCDMKIKRKPDLKIHMMYHTQDLPHSCNKCDKSFPRRGSLNWHLTTVHRGE